jgi:hypothetical protein
MLHFVGAGATDGFGAGVDLSFDPKEENESLAETAQVTQIKRHEHAGGLDFASPCG